jgi:hypothetical protein
MHSPLKLRTIGINDYSVLEGRQRIGRIRFAAERNPGVWIWNISIHLPGGLPMGSCQGSRHRQIQSGLGSVEGPHPGRAARGGPQGHEHPER